MEENKLSFATFLAVSALSEYAPANSYGSEAIRLVNQDAEADIKIIDIARAPVPLMLAGR